MAGVKTKGFDKWFQIELGRLLIKSGTEQATLAASGAEPHFLPKVRRHQWERPWTLPAPPDRRVDHRPPVNLLKELRAIVLRYNKQRNPVYLGGGHKRGGK
eukprot:753075-Prymnesium_polylepis.1